MFDRWRPVIYHLDSEPFLYLHHRHCKSQDIVFIDLLYPSHPGLPLVALGTTTIDSTPAIGVKWRRVPIQPAKYLHQWLSVKLVRTGFQNSGAFVSDYKGLITFDADTDGDGRKRIWSQKRQKERQSLDQLRRTDLD